jgi:branched-chain amino acid aminotransferase
MKIILDGHLVDARQARVSVFDHSFLYGDGIYETVRAYDYRVFHWPEHFRRLKRSSRRIHLKCPWSSSFLLDGIIRVLRANRTPEGSVRITISRGPGPLGLDPSLCPKPTLVMLLHPERPIQAFRRTGVSIGIPEVRRNHPRCLDPQIKSNNSLNTILARMEGKAMRVFETVLLNLDGDLTEGTTSNIFFARKSEIFTPALSCGLLEGITRESVIRLSRAAGRKVHEGHYTPMDLKSADEIFLSSTTLEIMPVVRVKRAGAALGEGRRCFIVGTGQPGPLSRELQNSFRTYVQKELCL